MTWIITAGVVLCIVGAFQKRPSEKVKGRLYWCSCPEALVANLTLFTDSKYGRRFTCVGCGGRVPTKTAERAIYEARCADFSAQMARLRFENRQRKIDALKAGKA